MTIIIHIEPEKREGMFGPAHALAALEGPVRVFMEACQSLNATVVVTGGESAPPAPTPRVRRSKAEIAEAKAAAAQALANAMPQAER